MKMVANRKRINANGQTVYDIWTDNRKFLATVAVDQTAVLNLRVLFGAMTNFGKTIAATAIDAHEVELAQRRA